MKQPNKLQHLTFISNIIDRHNRNSFLIKAWSGTWVAVVLGLGIKQASLLPILLGGLFPFGLWFYDAYYLYQERLFRKLYDKVREMKEEEIDFSMKRPREVCYVGVLFSKTMFLHLLFFGILVLYFFGLVIIKCCAISITSVLR